MPSHHNAYKGRSHTRKDFNQTFKKLTLDEKKKRRRLKKLLKRFSHLTFQICHHKAVSIYQHAVSSHKKASV